MNGIVGFLGHPALGASAPAASGLPIGWFDFVALVLLATGIFAGRKRGMSIEFLDVLRWLAIVIGGAMLYDPVGRLFAQISGAGLLASFLVIYIGFAALLSVLFYLFKRSMGEKLVSSEVFGSFEYYLGMLAGALRLACIIVFALAILNARRVSDEELTAKIKNQTQELGKVYFPPLGSIQNSVFKGSLSGSLIHDNLAFLLIAPTEPAASHHDTLGQQRQRELDEITGSKRK